MASPPTLPPLLCFLQLLQSAALLSFGPRDFDPKLYVDLPLKTDLASAESAFRQLPRRPSDGAIPAEDLNRFVEEHFDEAGSDLLPHVPSDFEDSPEGFLPGVDRPEVREWAVQVHSLWKQLCRRVSDSVREKPDSHTLLPLPEPVVIPGSRFREVYYWDSYWVIRGLLASKMYETAKGVVKNLVSLVESYGFVLNGARSYYTNRSQPPLLSSMIMEIYKKTGDVHLLKTSLPSLLSEYEFWNSELHKVVIGDAKGNHHTLNRYYAVWSKPRPESATIDQETASKLSDLGEKEHLFRQLASAAESGWDFSSRWMSDPFDLTTLCTTRILPVDLNTFILKMELDILDFARTLGETLVADRFEAASKSRTLAINTIFWNEEMGQWLDYWIDHQSNCKEPLEWEVQNQNRKVFVSNFMPIWVGVLTSGTMIEKVVNSLCSSGLLLPAGISTSILNSGQQWDFPNGWAPLQHMIAEGLVRYGSEDTKKLAANIARSWLRANYAAYKQTGYMYEKYDVEKCGSTGGGGEYAPQTGFGWSNGVVLAFLEEFGWPDDLHMDCSL